MFDMRIAVLSLVLLSLVLTGCDQIQQLPFMQKKGTQGTQGQYQSKQVMQVNGPLLARVDEWAIGLDDYNNYLNTARPLLESQNVDADSFDVKSALLNELVNQQILAKIALQRGLDKSPEFQRALNDAKTTMLVSVMRDNLDKSMDISYAEIQTFYDTNKALLRRPQEMQISELAVGSEPLAREIYIRLLEGEDFGYLARQYSVLDTSSDGGDLGYIIPDPNLKFPKFWEVVIGLDKGEKSSIFRGDDGNYYIVLVEDIKGGQEIPLSEVEADLRTALKQDKIAQEIQGMVNNFKTKAKVEVNEDLLR